MGRTEQQAQDAPNPPRREPEELPSSTTKHGGRMIELHDGFLILRVLPLYKEDRMRLDDLRILTMEQLL